MTNKQKAQEWYEEWEHSGFNSYGKDALLSFAAFCLDKREKFPMKELQRRHDIIMSEPDGIVRETMISNLLIDLP